MSIEDLYNPEYCKWINRRFGGQALKEGWVLAERDDRMLEIQRWQDDPAERFTDDHEARQHVMGKMLDGSCLHSLAYLLDGEPMRRAHV